MGSLKHIPKRRAVAVAAIPILFSIFVFSILFSFSFLSPSQLPGHVNQAGLFSWLGDLFSGGSGSSGQSSQTPIVNNSVIYTSSTQINFAAPENPNSMYQQGTASILATTQSETINNFSTCKVITYDQYPPDLPNSPGITDADAAAFNSQVETLDSVGYRATVGSGSTGLRVSIPRQSEKEWRCFIRNPPRGVRVEDCPPPAPMGTRFSCFGNGSGCWGRTASCPAGQVLRNIRAVNHPEQSDQSITTRIESVPWGFGQLTGAQMGERGDSLSRGNRDPSYLTSSVNGVGPRPAPIPCSAAGCLFPIPVPTTGSTITFGCRDQDSNSSGRCGIVVDLDCYDPNAPPPGSTQEPPSDDDC